MPNTDQRTEELRTQYRTTLIAIANEIGAVDRSAVNAVALGRIRHVLGEDGDTDWGAAPELELKECIVQYVLSLRQVLKELLGLDVGPEHQSVIGELEAALNSLLQTAP